MTQETSTENEFSVVVQELHPEAEGVVSVILVAPDGAELPAWNAGAHIDVFVGEHGVRQYSLSGDPLDRHLYRITVLREPAGRGGSGWVHDNLVRGQELTVREPRNHFELDAAGDYVFVAGGIGITPILAMIRTAHAAGKQWRLLYGGRTAASMAFLDELAEYGNRVELFDESTVGRIPLSTIAPGPDTLVYACGPEGLLGACEELAVTWPSGTLRLERFAALNIDSSNDQAFDVQLAQTGLTIRVPADASILQVLKTRGLSAMSSCEEGLCGTCEVDVLDGEVEHRDVVLSDEERQCGATMMICVSRARGDRLTLDL
ncbi:ferredoxin [Mycolicibacterium murale]|uniref:Ferredoxin n=1 Tax=Mycolicibacterium murale TaxID=182220 RepID=A0A7I9WND6_9MYCO|nr:PDR/VanB family oxidoreductase [Mycolicibacterium murale]MCV7180404.1 oxidoreductase [Mycolicibacterium murale]GFG58727.1 ferredoxin [Mycolicibacterium murale]